MPADRHEELLALWNQADELLASRGGYRRTRLHQALAADARFQFVNVADIGSVENWRSTIESPEFGAIATQLAEFHPTRALYQVIVDRAAPAQPESPSA